MHGIVISLSLCVLATLFAVPASAENAGGEFPGRMGEPTVPVGEPSPDETAPPSLFPSSMFIVLAPAALVVFFMHRWRGRSSRAGVPGGGPADDVFCGCPPDTAAPGGEPAARIFNMDAEAVVVCDCPECRALRGDRMDAG